MGDGPAAFLTLIVGAIVCAGAVVLELGAHPPVWVHVLVWPPLTILLVMALLRVAKGVLAATALRTRPPA